MSTKTNYSLIIALAALLLSVLAISYFWLDRKQEQAYVETITELKEDPLRVLGAVQATPEYCNMEAELSQAQDKLAELTDLLDTRNSEIKRLQAQLSGCRAQAKNPTIITEGDEEAEDLRALLVSITQSEQPQDYGSYPEEAIVDSEYAIPELDQEEEVKPAPIPVDRSVIPAPAPAVQKNSWRLGASISPGMGVIDRKFTVGAGVHTLLNDQAVFGADYLFGEDILLLKVGWFFDR